MKRKTYIKPVTQVIKFQHREQLLNNSGGVGAKGSRYGDAIEGEWGSN